jgi:ABC-type branched-subunit amino acid transport system ATPase component
MLGSHADNEAPFLLQSQIDRPHPKYLPKPRMLAPSAPQQVLSIRGLRKMYDDNVAVDDVSFEVSSNEIVGLLGPNGAGKTTTINMVLGVLEPGAGDISIAGVDLARNRSALSDARTSPLCMRSFREISRCTRTCGFSA